jgi:hypothetical protein
MGGLVLNPEERLCLQLDPNREIGEFGEGGAVGVSSYTKRMSMPCDTPIES